MTRSWLAILSLAAALTFGTPALIANQGHGNGNGQGNGHGNGNGKDKEHGNPHANKHADYDDDHGWVRGNGYEQRIYTDGRPPGWSQGKKTGWGNCGMPPGQAKKYGCRTYSYQGRPYYYYQDEIGRIIVRRPLISVHGGIDVLP